MTTRTKSIPFALGNTQQTDHKVGKCWTYIASAFLDETTDINSTATNDVPLGGTADDYIAFGCERTFDSISFDTQTTPAGGSQAIEYWNGAWVTLTTSGTVTQADNTTFYWDTPTDWATTTLNSEGDGPWYYIRIRVATNRTTAGALHAVNLGVQMKWANARSITIPETGVTIRHAFVHLVWDSSATTGIENKNVRVRFNAASFTAGVTRWTTTNAWTHGEAWKHTCTFDVTDQTVLDNLAMGAVNAFVIPPITMKVVVPAFVDPVYGTYEVGDDARIMITDDRFPNGLDAIYRIVGSSVEPGEDGPERVTLSLTTGTESEIV